MKYASSLAKFTIFRTKANIAHLGLHLLQYVLVGMTPQCSQILLLHLLKCNCFVKRRKLPQSYKAGVSFNVDLVGTLIKLCNRHFYMTEIYPSKLLSSFIKMFTEFAVFPSSKLLCIMSEFDKRIIHAHSFILSQDIKKSV